MCPQETPAGDVGAGLLKGEQRFFEPQPLASQEQPNRIVRDLDPARRKLVLQGVQREMRRSADPLHDEGAMRLQLGGQLARLDCFCDSCLQLVVRDPTASTPPVLVIGGSPRARRTCGQIAAAAVPVVVALRPRPVLSCERFFLGSFCCASTSSSRRF